MTTDLSHLLASPYLWRGRDAVAPAQTLPCGFDPLAALLVGGGWRVGANTELLLPQQGIGELQLLAPALRALQQPASPPRGQKQVREKQWIALVAPPYRPHLPAWTALGLTPQRLLWVNVPDVTKRLWAIEQLLRAGHCGAVLSWLPEHTIRDRDIRRLQQAAATGNCLHVLLRPASGASQVSASACRLVLTADRHALTVQVLKQRGQWSGQSCRLHFASHHGLNPPLPVWQWPLARANTRPPPTIAADDAGGDALPLINTVSRSGLA